MDHADLAEHAGLLVWDTCRVEAGCVIGREKMPSFPGEKKTLLRYHEALCPNNISIINISLYYRRFHHSQIFWRAHKKRDVDYIFPICCLSRHSCTSQTTAIEINEKAFRIVKMSVSRGNIFSMQVVYLLKAPAEQLPLRLMRMLTD